MSSSKHIDPKTQQGLKWFVDAHRHVAAPNEVDKMKWVVNAMALVDETKLSNTEKKAAVVTMYQDLAKDDTNGFNADYALGDAIELTWNIHKQRVGLKFRHKGWVAACLPCCSDASVSVGVDGVKISANPLEESAPKESAPKESPPNESAAAPVPACQK